MSRIDRNTATTLLALDPQPGDTLRVTGDKAWARWHMPDGDLLAGAKELGYERPIICIEVCDRYRRFKLGGNGDPFPCLAHASDEMLNNGNAVWEREV